jgi:hypothetical protein
VLEIRVLAVLLSLASCSRRATPAPAVETTSPVASAPLLDASAPDASAVVECDGSLGLRVEFRFGRLFVEQNFALSDNREFTITSPVGSEGEQIRCSGSLEPAEQRALAARVTAMALHTLPSRIVAPFVRDGTSLHINGGCGPNTIELLVANVFPSVIRELIDQLNTVLAAHCSADSRLPSGAQLALQYEDAAQMCADDCKACNTCSL